jgi:hypothetical protein
MKKHDNAEKIQRTQECEFWTEMPFFGIVTKKIDGGRTFLAWVWLGKD